MSEFIDSRKLFGVRVIDLRAELDKRGLDKTGIKRDLVERLRKALVNEGIDPEAYILAIGEKKPTKRLSTSSSSSNVQGDETTSSEKPESENNSKTEKANTEEQPNAEAEIADKKEDMEAETEKNDLEKGEQEVESSIDLTLDEEESINEENVDQATEKSEKNKQVLDEKTTPKETVQVEETTGTTTTTSTTSTSATTTTSTAPQQASKKNQDADTGTSASNGTSEESNQQKKQQSNPRILWITNVPKNTRANELKQLLSSCGKVVCAKVVVNARFPGSCCFGYVTMGTAEDATNVIAKLNNTEFNGQIIKIDKFENIKADNLNPARKNKTEEIKKPQPTEKKDDKAKKSPENKEKTEERKKSEDKEKTDKPISLNSSSSPEIVKSLASDRSSRGRRRTPSRERVRERERPFNRSTSRGDHRPNVLTFDKIKEERERQRLRDRERALREDNRRRHEEEMRLREMREITRRQRNEAERLEREREKLRIERDKIEREKSELIKLERERQRIEREKLEMEKMELQRSRLRLEEDRRAAKRQSTLPYRREDTFDDRKRPASERHFEEPPRFEPPHPSEPIPSKKFASSKDFKRLPYDKHEPFSDKRGRDYNSDRTHQGSSINRSNTSIKYDRSYDNMRERESRDAPSRDSQSNLPIRSKDSRYVERDRSPHFRSMPEGRDRHVSQGKPDRDHHFSEPNVSDRWNHPVTPQTKFGSGNQKPWATKGATWRPDPPNVDRSNVFRWNQSSSSSGRSMGQPFSGNSNLSPACPPPPGINNYSDRFDYNKSSTIRKY